LAFHCAVENCACPVSMSREIEALVNPGMVSVTYEPLTRSSGSLARMVTLVLSPAVVAP